MRFSEALLRGRLVRRYKRFLSEIRLDSGELVLAHCANPGSMKTCLVPGGVVWLSKSSAPGRKLAYTWEIAEVDGARVFVNPACANRLFAEALARGTIAELSGYQLLQREVTFAKSRLDFLLEHGKKRCFVEVKNVTLYLGNGRGAFPDSVTLRGRKHLEDLVSARRQGMRAVLFFCLSRSNASSVEPATGIDPDYARALRAAACAGVELLAYKATIALRGVSLRRPVPVRLGELPRSEG